MSTLFCPPDYRPLLDVFQTEKAIKILKDFFQQALSSELRLARVTAPLFVRAGTGLNDDLNGVEQPVSFQTAFLPSHRVEVVQSLAKWKRLALAKYGFQAGYGIYTDMNAIRPDEAPDNIHSLYVDQWDWERVITAEERNLDFLKRIVSGIYEALKRTEFFVYDQFPFLEPRLPDKITFIHAEDLQRAYPHLTPREREDEIVRQHGAVFIIGIGAPLADGQPHDGRAPDYDDWISETAPGYHGLNGDIIIWNPVLQRAYEISSMGIRVDETSLRRQLALAGAEERLQLPFHQKLMSGELPLTIGGGIGQSRLCMYYLRKAHIGEVQASIWPDDMLEQCRQHNVPLL